MHPIVKSGLALVVSVCASAHAADMFLVIGQSVGRSQADVARTFTIASTGKGGLIPQVSSQAAPLVPVATMMQATGLNDSRCVGSCSLSAYQLGAIPAFASTWQQLSKKAAHYVVRSKAQTALTAAADKSNNGAWSDFSSKNLNANLNSAAKAKASVYQDALADYVAAYASAAKLAEGIDHQYVIWMQGEQDAAAGVSADEYKAKLLELVDQLNADVQKSAIGKPFDAVFLVSTGYSYGADPATKETVTQHRDKADAVVQGQDAAAEIDPRIVLVSRAPRVFMSPCIDGLGTPGCLSSDLANYYTSAYDTLGAEMARNAFTFQSTGVKPLLASSCKDKPEACAATVDVYRWTLSNTGNTDKTANSAAAYVHGVDPKEHDRSGYKFGGVRYQLFKDAAPGRVALLSKWNAQLGRGMESVNAAEGGNAYATQATLGYCYAKPSDNAPKRLMRLRLNTDYVSTTSLPEAETLRSKGYQDDGVLCYVG